MGCVHIFIFCWLDALGCGFRFKFILRCFIHIPASEAKPAGRYKKFQLFPGDAFAIWAGAGCRADTAKAAPPKKISNSCSSRLLLSYRSTGEMQWEPGLDSRIFQDAAEFSAPARVSVLFQLSAGFCFG